MAFNSCVAVTTPAPLAMTIPASQWSGSGSDYYVTVNASNITADSILIPHYDEASAAYLNGLIWCVPAAGSFTIHTSAIPSGAVTVLIQFAGTNGDAQYQVLADVYSTSQALAKADVVDDLTSTATNVPLSANQGKILDEGKINYSDIVNNLTSTATDAPLSAAQGKALNLAKTDFFSIAATVNTWSGVYPYFAGISSTMSGFDAGPTPMGVISGGKLSTRYKGLIQKVDTGIYDIFAYSGYAPQKIYVWRITGFTSASATPTVSAVTSYRSDYKYYYNGPICSSSATSSGDVFSYFTDIPNGGYLLILYRPGYVWDDSASIYIIQHGSESSVYGKFTIKEGSNSNCPKLNSSGNVTLSAASQYSIGIVLIKLN